MVAATAKGCWITDMEGNRYLDAAGGALVNNIGHGDPGVVEAMSQQASSLDYVHASVFTSEILEAYATALAPLVPVDEPRIFPTSGGSEAVETALKLARAYHLTRGDTERDIVISREMSYHGNTVFALDVSGRKPLRRSYESWLGRSVKVPAVTEYRCPAPSHPDGCADWHVDRLEETISEIGASRIAAFIGEPIGGATLGATTPPDGYWPGIAEVCHRHGVLLIVDEVMTGFGRTGRWFGIDHYEIRPDILVTAKGAASGYWPLGLTVASGEIHDAVSGGFVHGFTFSHFPIGAAVALAVLNRILERRLVDAAASKGTTLLTNLRERLREVPVVGDVRGIGLLIAVELVADRGTRQPFPRSETMAERLTLEARNNGLLVYPSTGGADGTDGDLVLVGPPLIVSDDEMSLLVDRLAKSLEAL